MSAIKNSAHQWCKPKNLIWVDTFANSIVSLDTPEQDYNSLTFANGSSPNPAPGRVFALTTHTTCHVAMLVVCPPGVGRQTLHPSSPPATSALAATSSEEEGLHTGLPLHNVGMYLRGRGNPHKIGEYMQPVLRFVFSMAASRGVPALRMRLCWGTTQAGSLVTATHLEENASGASWGEAVAVGPRFHSPR